MNHHKKVTKKAVVKGMHSSDTLLVEVYAVESDKAYKKVVRKTKRFLVHYNQKHKIALNDSVEIEHCRKISKRKTWFLKRVLS